MRDFLIVLFRRKKMVISFFIFMVAVPMTLAYILPPKYEAQAKLILLPGREKKPFLPSERDARTGYVQVTMEDVGSEVELMLSHPILSDVVAKHRLEEDHPPSLEEPGKYIAYVILKGLKTFLVATGLKPDLPPHEEAVERLYNQVEVDFIKRTNIITVEWRDSSPELSRDVVNSLIDRYVGYRTKVYSNTYALDTVGQEARASYGRLSAQEDALSTYRRQHAISDVEQQRKAMLEKLNEAEGKLKLLKNLSDSEIATAELGNLSGDPVFLELSNRLTDAELRRVNLYETHGTQDRRIQAIHREIEEINALLKERLDLNLVTWQKLFNTYTLQLSRLDRAKIDIDRMARGITILTQRYNLNKEKESELLISGVMDAASIGSIRVAEYATIPASPSFPKKIPILIISLLFGVVGGTAFAFVFDRFSNRIVSASDVESTTQVPVLVSIQKYARKAYKNNALLLDALSRDLIPLKAIFAALSATASTSTLIVSPSPKSGNSFMTRYIARFIFQEFGGSVLHLSCRPTNGNVTDSKPSRSLPVSPPPDSHENRLDYLEVDILPESVCPCTTQVNAIREIMQEGYRHVFIDVETRLGPFYLHLVPYVSQILTVVEYDRTNKYAFQRTLGMIRRHKGAVMGCILNKMRNDIPAWLYRSF